MIARRSVWSDPEVQALLKSFVASADEVNRLQSGKDPECRLAQKVFEQGHYAGRTKPTNTRQGIYATAPSGVMLASINANEPKAIAAMLQRALDKWNALSESERMQAGDPGADTSKINRPEKRYPADGLVLRVFSRDLPRDKQPHDWRADAWNQDYAWFRSEEARSLLPAKLAKSEKGRVPDALIRRLAKLNFVDNVRGQTTAYSDEDVVAATLESEVVGVADGIATVKFRGTTHTHREGVWAIEGFKDMQAPGEHELEVDLKLFGSAQFDTAKSRFVSFEVLAVGTRSGATQYNGRHDDVDSAPIGFYLTLAGNTPAEHVAPAFYWSYGWR
ncbi:MAG: hypothetical protein ABI054_04170 [Planctomycetota bacterium]